MLSWYKNIKLRTVFYAVLALVVMGPMLLPGYILTLDMVFTPKLPMPDVVDNTYVFNVLLHILDLVLPSWLIQKVMLFLILFLSGLGMHMLVKVTQPKVKGKLPSTTRYSLTTKLPAYFAGTLYMINPFTYSRFMAGQYLVLLGYAVMPFFVRALLKFIAEPRKKALLPLMVWALIISIVSIHYIGLIALTGIVGIGFGIWYYRKDRTRLKRLIGCSLLGVVVLGILSSYWLVPALSGSSQTVQTIDTFDNTNREVFATLGNGPFGSLLKVAGLQGFWADARGLYKPVSILGPVQLLALPLLLGLVGYGTVHGMRGRVRLTGFFIIITAAAVVLAVGTTGLLAPLNRWLTDNIPFFIGYREPQKFVGLLVLGYAWLSARGLRALLAEIQNSKSETNAHRRTISFKLIGANFVVAAIMVLPLLYTPTMLWGFNGQLRPRQYPEEWEALNARLKDDEGEYKVLFLPWHQYMSFSFSRRIIANPADAYFEKSVIVSTNPELGNLKDANQSEANRYVEQEILPYFKEKGLAQKLTQANIKYVIVARELDYLQYSSLIAQRNIKLEEIAQSYTLYRNQGIE